MAKLTIRELEALTPKKIGETVRDDGGLRGKVRPNGRTKNGVSVTFVFRYKFETKTKDVCARLNLTSATQSCAIWIDQNR